jgi:broad specificity phosphatase PhoE
MRKLLLIRHAQTRPVAGVRPAEFPLTEEGRRNCVAFARELARRQPAVIVTSEESKARETGEIIARTLALPVESFPGLEEHHRGVVEQLASPADFQDSIEQVFDVPDRIVYGEESAEDALARFSGAIEGVLQAHPEGHVAVVTHGTVMALFVAAHNEIDVKGFWSGLKMPDLAVLQVPGFALDRSL